MRKACIQYIVFSFVYLFEGLAGWVWGGNMRWACVGWDGGVRKTCEGGAGGGCRLRLCRLRQPNNVREMGGGETIAYWRSMLNDLLGE